MKSLLPTTAVVALLALSGCPESSPPSAPSTNQPGKPGEAGAPGPGTPGSGPMAAQSPSGGASGPAPSVTDFKTAGTVIGGTFSGSVPESEVKPRFTQDDLVGTDAVEVSGTLACDGCEGDLLVRVLPPPPDPKSGGGGPPEIQLITSKSFDAPGPFTLLIPASENVVVLQVVDDSNSDGQPTSGERMGMPSDGPLVLSKTTTGIALQVGSFPDGPAVDPMGNPMQAAPEGGPATVPGPDAAAEGKAADPAGGGAPPVGEGAPKGGAPPAGG